MAIRLAQVSTTGGTRPLWARNGQELSPLRVGSCRMGSSVDGRGRLRCWHCPNGAPYPTHVTLIFNFFDELRRVAPLTKR